MKASYLSQSSVSAIVLQSGPSTLIGDSYVVNQAGKKEVCKCESTIYTLDVTQASGAQAMILTVAYPSIANGGVDPSTGLYSADEFLKYLHHHPELVVASGPWTGSDFGNLPDIVTFTSKQLGQLCNLGYKQLYLMDTGNGPPTPIFDSNSVPHITWNIDCCSDSCENQKRETARYCYPRPLHTGKICGLSLGLTRQQREACRLGCPKYWHTKNLRLL